MTTDYHRLSSAAGRGTADFEIAWSRLVAELRDATETERQIRLAELQRDVAALEGAALAAEVVQALNEGIDRAA